MLVWALTAREIRQRYRRSLLGPAWAVLYPALMTVVFSILRGVTGVGSDGVHPLLFAYAGIVPFTFFQAAVVAAGPSVVANQGIVRKIAVPLEAFPLSAVCVALFDMAASSVVLVGLMCWLGTAVTWQILWVPALTALAAALAFGVGLLVAALGTFRRDVIFGIQFVLQALLFATPVMYPLSAVPERWRTVFALNPLTGIVQGFRNVLLHGTPPPAGPLLLGAAVTAATLVVCWLLFRSLSRHFVDVL
jgi:lipopolysaccharide transport system permease protein